MPRPSRVILLRSASGDPDPYVQAFADAGFAATCEPVLRFAFPHQGAVRERLAHPSRYGGLILTSPRAARALDEALVLLPDQVAAWTAQPAYAVGPRTAEALRELGFAPEGEESGEAEALAARIAEREAADAKPLLFLCGNRRREALPDGLRTEGVAFEEQVVYETHARDDLDFSEAAPDWLAFFSPSGLEAVQQARGLDPRAVRLAAIGPTTAAALEEAGYAAEAVAAEPTPEALAAAIRSSSR